MLVNLVPEFLAALEARDPLDAYRRYLTEHEQVLGAYWRNYVLDLDSPHAEGVIRRALAAGRRDLRELMSRPWPRTPWTCARRCSRSTGRQTCT
jgi:hypothetical protein